MPRKCIICGASQGINLSVFPFPKSLRERTAWIAVLQDVVPGYEDPLNQDTVMASRTGICAKHFHPGDVKKGKTSRLDKSAVPLHPITSRQLSVTEDSLDDENKNEVEIQKKTSDCLVVGEFDDYLSSVSQIEPKDISSEESLGLNKTDDIQDVCLVCGKINKNLVMLCNLQNLSDNNSLTSISLLMRILGKPKRDIFVVSLKICNICANLIQEVSLLEENLKGKKQVIKSLFETTLKDHKEKKKAANDTESFTCQSSDVDYNTTQSKMEEESCVLTDEGSLRQQRSGSRRQATSKSFYCFTCKESFHSLALWVQHCSKHIDNDDINHSQNSRKPSRIQKRKMTGVHKCKDCEKTFRNKRSLLKHIPAHQKESECNVCGRYLTTKARLTAHLFKMHGIGEEKNKEIECTDCGKTFSTKAGLRYHRNVIHHVGKKYICEQCNKVFYYHVPYRSHLLYAHGEKKVICETCGETFYTVAKLNAHINAVHRSAKSWCCKECDSKFTTDTAYRHHMNVKHLKVQHTCDYCGTVFRKKSTLVMHLWKHSVYICPLCKDNFSQTDDLKGHMSQIHGKDITMKSRRKQNSQLVQKKREESVIRVKTEQEEAVVQNEHVNSIVINDLLIAAESYNSNGLQSFRLSECQKLPEKTNYSGGEDLKVQEMDIIDATTDLQSVDTVQFDTVESLQIKASSDQIGMAPGVSLINVQILGDMEISQSDTLDLKTSMLGDAADHMSHERQLESEDNITGRLTVETHHLTADELSVGNDLGSTSHTLDHTDIETPCHLEVSGSLDAAQHLEVTHQLDASHALQVETAAHLEVTQHIESSDTLKVVSIDAVNRDSNTPCLGTTNSIKASDSIEPKDLEISSHMTSSVIGDPSQLEPTNPCSLPSMMSHIDNEVREEITSQMSPHMHDISTNVGNAMTSHIGSDIHDITSQVSSQIVDPVSEHMASQMQAQIDHITASVNEVDADIVAHIDSSISSIEDEVNAHIVDHVETRMNADIDPHMAQGSSDLTTDSLDKQLEKMDGVNLEPFSVTLDQKDLQYQYVMYISASAEDSNPD